MSEKYPTRAYDSGDVIFREGESASEAYLVKTGNVRITRNKEDGEARTLANLAVGDILGEMALISDAPRSASALAVDAVTLVVVSRDELDARLKKTDPVVHRILQTLVARLRAQADIIAAAGH
ncbi:MAG: cyclic nucleotide-binding domain-containing protein [Rhodospirillales bacterium]|nr:cyclic nucleotide-binding domain-containing protein [Rhodospirillales bacterium]MCW8860821.1 cyclic nucleotide-binding domain-containing protein [Rhodospirillales bacterium]MCW8952499.1 cyclic nucleotide-binding domain-containing protein [Rhodospirillales bacterium]MCW8970866.1 cyclic nucleotide-binding domain-containing protein [Rhodospirillales bacterium]MCW9003539.1 cyclic nucleotide-binding domain-containing protein [Rhodospirillales bacterium]